MCLWEPPPSGLTVLGNTLRVCGFLLQTAANHPHSSDLLTQGDSLTSVVSVNTFPAFGAAITSCKWFLGQIKPPFKEEEDEIMRFSPAQADFFGWGILEAFWKDDACQTEEPH